MGPLVPFAAGFVRFMFVSLPVMLMAMIGYYVVGCPCLYDASDNFDEEGDDDAEDTRAMQKFFKKNEPNGVSIIGLSGVIVSLACIIVWLVNPVPEDERSDYAIQTLLFFPQTWLYWFAQTAFIQYCPSERFVNFLLHSPLKPLTGLSIGFGRWHAARRKTIDMVALRVRERGEANFMNSRLSFHRIDSGRERVTDFYKTFAVVHEPVPRIARTQAVNALKAQLAKAVGNGLLPPRLISHLHSNAFHSTCVAKLGKSYAPEPPLKDMSTTARLMRAITGPPEAKPLPAAPVLAKLVYAIQQDLLFLPGNESLSPQCLLLMHPFTTQGWVKAWAQVEGLHDSNSKEQLNLRTLLIGWVALCRALLMANAACVMARVYGDSPLSTVPWGAHQATNDSTAPSIINALDHGLELLGNKFVMRFLQVGRSLNQRKSVVACLACVCSCICASQESFYEFTIFRSFNYD